jgi:hypothetical protein
MRFARLQCATIVGLLAMSGSTLLAAPFQNLDFEQALAVPARGNGVVPFDAFDPIFSFFALPSWTVTENSTVCNSIWGAPVALDETSVALVSKDPEPFPTDEPMQGKFSVQMTSFDEDIQEFFQTSTISQTGTVPAGTKSIQFLLGVPPTFGDFVGEPIVTLNGVVIPLVTESVSGSTSLVEGDVSAFAGSTVNLAFKAAAVENGSFPTDENGFDLDAISFSTAQVVPEPSSLGIVAVGAFLLGRKRGVKLS